MISHGKADVEVSVKPLPSAGIAFRRCRPAEFQAGSHRPPANRPAVKILPGITLQADKIYTVFARRFVGGSGARAFGAEIIVNK
jgi:hypothetical protein